MSIAAEITETVYQLAGANLGPFNTDWTYVSPSDVTVTLDPGDGDLQALAQGVNYTLAAIVPTTTSGGTVTLGADLLPAGGAWALGARLILARDSTTATQTGWGSSLAFDPQQPATSIDDVMRKVQELATEQTRAISVSPGEAAAPLPGPNARRGLFAFFADTAAAPLIAATAGMITALFKGDPGGNIMSVGLRSAVPNLNIPVGTDLIRTSGYRAVGVGSAFYCATNDANTGGAQYVTTANGRVFKLCAERINVDHFGGGVGDGVDDGPCIQEAHEYCQSVGATLYFSSTVYNLLAPLTLSGRLNWKGPGYAGCSIAYSGPAGSTAITVDLSAFVSGAFIRALAITCPVLGSADHGLKFLVTNNPNGQMNEWDITGCSIYGFNLQGLVFDNSIGNPNGGFAVGDIDDCIITGGVLIIDGGDSLTIQDTVLTIAAPSHATTTAAVTGSFTSGARKFRLINVSMTCGGGALNLTNADGFTMRDCECEHPGYYNVNYPYNATLGAMVVLYNCGTPVIEDTYIQPGLTISPAGVVCPNFAIIHEGPNANGGSFRHNELFKGNTGHIGIGVSGGGSLCDVGPNYYDQAPVIVQTTPTAFPQIGLPFTLDLINGWVADATLNEPAPYMLLSPDGTGKLFGSVSGGAGVVCNLPPQISTKLSYSLTPARLVSNAVSVVEVAAGVGAAVSFAASAGAYGSLTGATFSYSPQVFE